MVNLTNASVISNFSAGTTNITDIDIFEDRRIILNSTLTNVTRDPDGVVWLGKKSEFFATADEGVTEAGGSRSFSVFNEDGEVAFTSGHEGWEKTQLKLKDKSVQASFSKPALQRVYVLFNASHR